MLFVAKWGSICMMTTEKSGKAHVVHVIPVAMPLSYTTISNWFELITCLITFHCNPCFLFKFKTFIVRIMLLFLIIYEYNYRAWHLISSFIDQVIQIYAVE